MNINEKFLQNAGKDFWDSCDETFQAIQNDHNFIRVWDLVELYPRQFNRTEIEDLHDRVFIALCNKNKIVKRIDPGCKLYMLLTMVREISHNPSLAHLRDGMKGLTFQQWYETGSLDIYRGIPRMDYEHSMDPPTGLSDNMYSSFTLTENTAKMFTQSGWAGMRNIRHVERQNGWICRMTVKIQDIHIFCTEENADEVVVKGPRNYVEVKKIRKGQVL